MSNAAEIGKHLIAIDTQSENAFIDLANELARSHHPAFVANIFAAAAGHYARFAANHCRCGTCERLSNPATLVELFSNDIDAIIDKEQNEAETGTVRSGDRSGAARPDKTLP